MNTKNLFVIDFSKSSIVASATTLKKARKPESSEYRVLTELCVRIRISALSKRTSRRSPERRPTKG